MKVLITLEPYARKANPYNILSKLNCGNVVEWGRNKAIIDLANCPDNALERLRDIDYVSHISIIDKVINRDLNTLFNVTKELLTSIINNGTLKVIVRRMDKKFPMTSVELSKRLGQYLAQYAKTDLEDPDYYIYIEVRDNSFIIAHSTRDLYRKRRVSIPNTWAERIVGIVEGPSTVYETMDLIQLSHALGIELRLITNTALIERAYKSLRLGYLPNVKVVSKDDALEGVDLLIVLSMHAKYNEEKLIEISKETFRKNLRIGLILGNEYDDVSLDLRGKAHYEIRLGPSTGHPMRTTIALTYALSLIFTTWLMMINETSRGGD
ncbi:MAG: THUMP domain-containing protein [Vulcanisaeta sp. AZ3]